MLGPHLEGELGGLGDADGRTAERGLVRTVSLGLRDHGVDGRHVRGREVALGLHLSEVRLHDRILDDPDRHRESLGGRVGRRLAVLVGEEAHATALVGRRTRQGGRRLDDVRRVGHAEVAVDAGALEELTCRGLALVGADPAAIGASGTLGHPDADGSAEGGGRDGLRLRSLGDRNRRQTPERHEDGDDRGQADRPGQRLGPTHSDHSFTYVLRYITYSSC